MQTEIDISQNRRDKKYNLNEVALRILWSGAKILFFLTPRPFFGMRRALLRVFGAEIGSNVNIYPSSKIYFPWNLKVGDWSAIGENALIYNLGKITIGEKVTISHNAHLCAGTHDYTRVTLPLLKPEIHICNQAWVCADAFIGPGIVVGEGSIIGARAVLTSNSEKWGIYAGNPAKFLKKRKIKE